MWSGASTGMIKSPLKIVCDSGPIIHLEELNCLHLLADFEEILDYNCKMPDEDLLQLANEEKRIFITNDKDFGDLIFLQKKLSVGTILFRVKGQKSEEKIKLMKKLLMGYHDKLLNHYVVITKLKIRIIPLGDVR
jgi:predicted nuclease of predicted toxin-antitoxin system